MEQIMDIAEGSLVVVANVHRLYEFMVDPAHLDILLGGGLADVDEVQPLPGGGYTYRCVHHWEKFPIWAQGATTVLVPDERIVIESMGGIDMISSWSFEPEGDGTRVTVTLEVPSTGLLLPRISPKTITQKLREAIEISLANIQNIAARLSAEPTGGVATAV